MVASASSRTVQFYSEWQSATGEIRLHYAALSETASAMGLDQLGARWSNARRRVDLDAVTFYLEPGTFRNMPTDFLPRVIPIQHWETIATGVSQRIRAINRFLVDLYNGGQDVVPDEVIYTSQYFYPEVQGFRPPRDVFVHIYGIDLNQSQGGMSFAGG